MAFDYSISICDGNTLVAKRLIKVVAMGDGGFSIFIPKHKSNVGFLAKHKHIYSYEEDSIISPFDSWQSFSADTTVKMSYHKDGFVQFSSNSQKKIISGIDNEGNIKGLGLYMKNPLYETIKTGPTIGIQIWGLEGFYGLKSKNKEKNIMFSENDFIFWDFSSKQFVNWASSKQEWNTYIIEGFLFNVSRYWSKVEYKKNKLVLNSHKIDYLSHFSNNLEFKVFRFKGQDIFFGFLVRKVKNDFPDRGKSGYLMHSPRDRDENQLFASYPALCIPDEYISPTESLDYVEAL